MRWEVSHGLDRPWSPPSVASESSLPRALVGQDGNVTPSWFFTRRVVSDRFSRGEPIPSVILSISGGETLQRPWDGH